MIFDVLMDIVRSHVVLSESPLKHVGMEINRARMAASEFTDSLSNELLCSNQKHRPKTLCGKLANMCHFDSFLTVAAAPDTLLSG